MPKCDSNNIKKKKVVLFPEICRVKIFLSPNLPHMSNVYENIYFLFQKKHTQTKKFQLANLFVQIYFFSYQIITFFNKEKYC